MMTIVSKRHIFKFYLTIVLGTFFFLALATALLVVYNKQVDKGDLKPKGKLMPLFSIAICVFAGYSLYRYIKSAPTITLDKDFIKFNSQTFSLADIDKVELTGKQPFKYAINFPMEAATLTFTGGEKKYIFDDFYSNSWEIKSFLKQVVIDKKNIFESTETSIDAGILDRDCYETYSGTAITSLRGISLWGLIGFFVYMLLNNSRPTTTGLVVAFSCFSVFWFLLHTYLMNYFQVSDTYFVIRNHNFFSAKKAYRIADIEEVVFETQGKMPNCLRIITKNFKNKLYPAGTLRDKTWLALKDKLEGCNIKVRNECI